MLTAAHVLSLGLWLSPGLCDDVMFAHECRPQRRFRHELQEFMADAHCLLGRVTSLEQAIKSTSTDCAQEASLSQSLPLVDGHCRSTVISSLFFVGIDQIQSTLSLGPVLGESNLLKYQRNDSDA